MAEEEFRSPVARALQEHAFTYPEVAESPSCVNRSFKARKKSFLFLGEKPDGMLRLMVKLDDGIASATKIAEANPDGWGVGDPGWITGNFTDENAPPLALMKEWIDESFRLQAPERLLAEFEALEQE